nr:vascular endothelial growth factor receptor 2-like [Cherax quadricarinatus]
MTSLTDLRWTWSHQHQVINSHCYLTNYSRVCEAVLGSVTLAADGNYSCIGTISGTNPGSTITTGTNTGSGTVEKFVNLKVQRMESPVWTTNLTLNTTHHLHKRETLRLECTATGVPPPAYHWSKDGVEVNTTKDANVVLDADEGVLTVQKATPEDTGFYECLVMNRAGTLQAWFMVSYVPATQVHHCE